MLNVCLLAAGGSGFAWPMVVGLAGLALLCLRAGEETLYRPAPSTDLQSLYDAIAAGVIVRGQDGRVVHVNPAAAEIIGLPTGQELESVERDHVEFVTEEGQPIPPHDWPSRRTLRTGQGIRNEVLGVRISPGPTRWLLVNSNLLAPGPGEANTVAVVTFVDCTAQKQAADAVQQTEAKLRNMLRAAPVGFGILHERHFLWANENLCQLFGRCEEDLLGSNIRRLYQDESEYRRVGNTVYRQMSENGVGYTQARFRRADGRAFDGHVQVAPLEEGDPRGKVAVAVVDITEQKNAERELRESNISLRRKNIALDEMTHQIRHERQELADRIACEADRLLLPLVSRLERSLDDRDRQYLQALVDDFRAVLQPYRRATSGRLASLTTTEMRIATLIRRGLTAKEIAQAESLSPATVNTHRANIRKKLDLRGKRVNLATHLQEVFTSAAV